jgi:hypothetical protein
MDAQTTLPPTSFGLPSIVTVVPPAPASALDEAALELLDEDSLELDDDDDPDEDLSPDEQPARPATTIAAPPTATSKLCFTTVLLIVLAIRQDQTDRPRQYGVPPTSRHTFAGKTFRGFAGNRVAFTRRFTRARLRDPSNRPAVGSRI